MRKYLLLTAALLLIGAHAHAQNWKLLDPPTQDDITGLDFVSPEVGFGCTRLGEIIRTTDGGATWTVRRVAFDIVLEDISFFDSKIGLVCGQNGALYRTTDGGEKWVSVSPAPGNKNQTFFSVELFDSRNGLAVGMNNLPENPYADLAYRTTDGGLTWKKLDPMGMGYADIFYSPNAGIAFPAFGQLVRSTDLGKSWKQLLTPDGGIARDVAIFGNTVLIAGPKGFIGWSRDSGISWTKTSRAEDKVFVAVALIDNKIGFVGGLNSTMLYTSDGGQNWSDELLARSFDIFDMAVVGNRVYAAGSGGALIYKDIK